MKHDFSIRDIVGALKTVRGVKNYYSDAQLAHLVDEAREVNAILDALPETEQQPVVMNYDLSEDIWDKARNVTGLSEDSARYADLIPESQLLVETALQLVLDEHSNPDPVADEWEECAHEDIRADERFLVKLDGWTFEGRRSRGRDLVIKLPGVDKYIDTSFIAQLAGNTKTGRARFFRIPAPVQHPDPTVFSAIYVKDCDVVGFVPKIMVWFREAYVAGHQCLAPERITDWEPVKFDPVGDA